MRIIASLFLLAACGEPILSTSVEAIQGPRGERGETGPQGIAGASGSSCEVIELVASPLTPNGGALVECASTAVVIHNGEKGDVGEAGADGQDAVLPPMTISQVIDPCGKQAAFDEVIFKMQNNKLYALYYAPPNSFLTELSNSSYTTTDGTFCSFTTNNGVVTSSPPAVIQ